jgi:hypothetical protein
MLLGAIATLGIVTAGDDDADRRPVQISRLTQMEQSGEMHDILERRGTVPVDSRRW